MAAPLSPERLLRTLDKWGVPYTLYPGWKTRTRPGSCNPVGFIIHHTGGQFTESRAYLKFLFETGRPSEGIPGPLCQFAIGPSGMVHVGSLGRANHAGKGSPTTLAKIKSEDYPGYASEIRPGSDGIDGNAVYWGVEICYPGTVPMKSAQYASAVLLSAAIVAEFGWTALSVLAHREHSLRKGDPFGVFMAKFRRDVRDLLAAGPGGAGSPGEDEDMTPEQDARLEHVETMLEQIAPINLSHRTQVPANTRLLVSKDLQPIRAALAELTGREVGDVDEAALARELATVLTPAVVAELGDFTEEQVENALRRVLGGLDEQD